MNSAWFGSLVLGGVLAAFSVACSQQSSAAPASSANDSSQDTLVARGAMLVLTGDCNACHTPKKMGPAGPEPDMSRMLSGHSENDGISTPYAPVPNTPWMIAATLDTTAWSGPWGVSFAANLTPDPNTGLRSGVWTEDLFVKTLRTGKHMGTARDLLPPMPWQGLGKLSDEDLKAIWTYLGTIPPINNHVPEPLPPAAPTTTQ